MTALQKYLGKIKAFQSNYDDSDGTNGRQGKTYIKFMKKLKLLDKDEQLRISKKVCERIKRWSTEIGDIEDLLQEKFNMGEVFRGDSMAFLAGQGWTKAELMALYNRQKKDRRFAKAFKQLLEQYSTNDWEPNESESFFRGVLSDSHELF